MAKDKFVTIDFETAEFNKTLKKYLKVNKKSTSEVIRKVAFDLTAKIIGGLPNRKRFKLSKQERVKITGRHPV